MSAADKFKKAGAAKRFEAAKGPAIPEEPSKPEAQSQGETALHSGLQGVSLGLADEAQGLIGGAAEGGAMALEALGLKDAPEDLADPVTGESTRKSALQRLLKSYEQARDWERSAVHQGEHDNPKTALASEVVGSLVAPGPKGTKGLKGLARVGEGALTGAKMGAAYGFGKSEGDGVGDVALDTAKGAGLGALTGGAIGTVSAVAQPMLKRIADRRAYKALDPYMKSLDPLMNKSPAGNKMQEADRLGRKALDNSLIGFGDDSAGIARKAAEATDETGEMLGGTLQRIQDETAGKSRSLTHAAGKPVDLTDIIGDMHRRAEEAMAAGNVDLSKALTKEADDLFSVASAMERKAPKPMNVDLGLGMTLPEAEGMKRTAQAAIKPADYAKLASPSIEANKALQNSWKRAVEDAVGEMAGPEDLDQFKALKSRYGDLTTLSDTAGYGSGRLARNNSLSLGDQQMAQVGAASGGDLKALLYALLNKAGRERGSSSAAALTDALQKGGTHPDLPMAGLTGALSDVEAQSLTTEEEKKRALAERFRSLLGD